MWVAAHHLPEALNRRVDASLFYQDKAKLVSTCRVIGPQSHCRSIAFLSLREAPQGQQQSPIRMMDSGRIWPPQQRVAEQWQTDRGLTPRGQGLRKVAQDLS